MGVFHTLLLIEVLLPASHCVVGFIVFAMRDILLLYYCFTAISMSLGQCENQNPSVT